VRELLAGRCLGCHGAERQRSGLRLDRRESALAVRGPGRAAVVPFASERSELVRRVRATDDDVMPAVGEPLAADEVELLVRWIDGGAPWPRGLERQHWAYVAPVRPEVPAVADEAWPRNAIDRFVLARLEAEGLAPAPEADRATLLRRLSLDLVGLPPTPEELAAFLADEREDAYERQVERLLDSPHFGERWGRHWLDLARYSDSNGYSRDFERSIWPYRDWVVDALNADLPFDRFTVEQLAGDLLPDPTVEQLVATGFHRNTLVQDEGGADDEEFRVEAVKNRVETTGTVWLGSTLNCAQCHDHKYDPFEQSDYYELFAFFNQTEDRGRSTAPRIELPTAAERELLAELDPEIRALDARLATMTPELREAQARWARDYRGGGDWTLLAPRRASSTGSGELEVLADGVVAPRGEAPDEAVYSILAESPLEVVTGFRLEALTDPGSLATGPGRGADGNFVLTEFVVTLPDRDEGAEPRPLAIERATTSFAYRRGPGRHSFDGDRASGWAVTTRTGISHQIVYTLAEPLRLEPGALLHVDLEQEFGDRLVLGRFRLAVTGREPPPPAAVIPLELLEAIFRTPAAERTPEQRAQLDRFFLSVTPLLDPLRAERERLVAQRPEPATTLVMRATERRRASYVLRRGSFLDPGERVEPDVPDFLPPLAEVDGRPTRLELARWLVDRANPLTARVQVNRWWQRLFGRGLVATENDFGTRGERPSHPALLDWLAVELMEDGWSLKRSLRRMVRSATYRQRSDGRPAVRELDPRNRLLARQARLRLEGEVVRDSALVASGSLVRTLGGPPVHPPLPAFESVLAAEKEWPESTGPDRFRRTLYTRHWRNSPYPFVDTFDGPGSNDACTRRASSNTPLQALVMANDPMVLELAGALARRALAAPRASDAERIEAAFGWCLARRPTAAELAVLGAYLDGERASFAAARDAARLAAPDPLPAAVDVVEAAAWTSLARVLFNLDEFLTRG